MQALRELTWKASTKGFDKVGKDIDQFNKKVDGSKSKMSGLGDRLTSIGSKLKVQGENLTKYGKKITKITAPLTALGVASVKMANDLDTSIRKVTTLTDENVLPVKQIKADVKEISHQTGIAQKEVAESMYEALSAGVDQKKLTQFTKSAITLTEAGFTDMSTAIDATTSILNAYGDKAYEVSKINDILVQTQNKGKITVDQLGSNIGNLTSVVAPLGVNLDQIGASYAILTAKGQRAEIATTNLKAMFAELGKTGSKSDKALKQISGKSFAELTAEGKNVGEILGMLDQQAKASGETLKDMFGSIQAGSGALTLASDGIEGYNKSLADMQKSDGIAKETAEKMQGPAKAVKKAFNDMKISMTELGGQLAPYITKLAGFVSKLANKFDSLNDSTKQSIVEWGAIAVAIGPVTMAVGSLISTGGILLMGVGKVIGIGGQLIGLIMPLISLVGGTLVSAISMVSAPFLAIAGAIGAVIAIGVNLYNHWNEVKAKAQELGGGLKGYLLASIKVTGQGFVDLKNKAVNALSRIANKWNSVKEFLKHPIKGTISILENHSKGGGDKKGKADGSHATGLNRVPFDNYLGNLHSGEMVLPARTAELYRSMGGDIHNIPATTNNSNANYTANVSITVNGNGDAKELASTVRSELDNMFRDLRLQGV